MPNKKSTLNEKPLAKVAGKTMLMVLPSKIDKSKAKELIVVSAMTDPIGILILELPYATLAISMSIESAVTNSKISSIYIQPFFLLFLTYDICQKKVHF
jgi:CMP-2-keto-3-deoxyoctulosonic acid synthetase